MEIGFSRQSDAALFSDSSRLRRKYGTSCTDKIERRFAQIAAAATLEVLCALPQARCHQLVANHSEHFSLDLDHPLRMIVGIAHDPVPRLRDGGIDRAKVTRLRFVEIGDTH